MSKIFLTSSISCVAHDVKRYMQTNTLRLANITTTIEPHKEQDDLSWFYKDRQSLENIG